MTLRALGNWGEILAGSLGVENLTVFDVGIVMILTPKMVVGLCGLFGRKIGTKIPTRVIREIVVTGDPNAVSSGRSNYEEKFPVRDDGELRRAGDG